MSESRHGRIRELFLAASDLSAADREAFLAGACDDDPDLRQEVESLLVHHEEPTEVDLASRPTRPSSRSRARYEAGHVFAGRYRIVSEIGRGGMGEVFRAHDLMLDEAVAIKFLPAALQPHLEHLLNEVRMARQVTHPNVCRVYDFGEADGETFLTMEYIDGENLASLLGRIGRLPGDKLLDLARQLATGLAAAHDRGVLHRDLKPANIMIDGRGQARITDFGIATTAAPDDKPTGGTRAGTPAYMAPEQTHDGQISVQSDLYALGLVLHEMATGKPVFAAETPAEVSKLHREANPTPPSHQVDSLDPRLESVILECLAKDPRDRPASAHAIVAALPAGDLLRRALEAGETPSPDVVAAADAGNTPRPGEANALVGLLFALLAAVLFTGDRAYPDRAVWQQRSPEVLADRAAGILRDLGYPETPVDRAWGFMQDIQREGSETGLFWYRQADHHLIPEDLMVADYPRIDYEDPPSREEDMIRLLLDAEGRLLALVATPTATPAATPAEEDAADGEVEASDHPVPGDSAANAPPDVDWGPVLRAAGFEPARLAATAPTQRPAIFADTHAAWSTATDDGAVSIEAAAESGRIVFFDVQSETTEEPPTVFDFNSLWEGYVILAQLFWCGLAAAAVVLARANLIAGRGDLPSARRLACFLVAINLAAWLLSGDHAPDFEAGALRLQAAIGRILFDAGLAWLAYVALEPTVRRWRPQALIAWSRLLRGRATDALVGRGLLLGAVVGTGWVLLTQLDRLVVRWLDFPTAGEIMILDQLETALSGRLLFASVMTSAASATIWGVMDLFFWVALRVLLRRWWLATLLFVAVNGLFETLEGMHPGVSWLILGVGIAGITAWVIVRFGLLAYASALFCYFTLLSAPITASASAWFAETGLFALALVAGLGLFGWRTALAGAGSAVARVEPRIAVG